MQTKKNKKMYTLLLCIMLMVMMAVTGIGCGNKEQKDGNQEAAVGTEAVNMGIDETESFAEELELNVLGEGSVSFLFTVVDKDGNEADFTIYTEKEMVGEALLEVGLIAGEEGQYGLYVKTVNGITADYDIDGTYWAFYVNGEYASSGVDTIPITEGETYCFKVEK